MKRVPVKPPKSPSNLKVMRFLLKTRPHLVIACRSGFWMKRGELTNELWGWGSGYWWEVISATTRKEWIEQGELAATHFGLTFGKRDYRGAKFYRVKKAGKVNA